MKPKSITVKSLLEPTRLRVWNDEETFLPFFARTVTFPFISFYKHLRLQISLRYLSRVVQKFSIQPTNFMAPWNFSRAETPSTVSEPPRSDSSKKKPRYPASLRKLVPTFKHKHRASPPPPKEEKKRGPAFTRPKPPLKTISLRWSVLKWTFSRSGWNGVGTRPSSSSLLPLPPPPRPFSFLIRGHLSFPRYTVWLLRSTFQNLPSSGVGTKSARFCFGLLHRAAAVFRRLTLCECCSPRRCAQPSYPRISALVFDERGDERVAREIRLMERGERIPGAFVISLLDRARVELPTRVFPRGRVIHWRRSFVSFRREPPLNRD